MTLPRRRAVLHARCGRGYTDARIVLEGTCTVWSALFHPIVYFCCTDSRYASVFCCLCHVSIYFLNRRPGSTDFSRTWPLRASVSSSILDTVGIAALLRQKPNGYSSSTFPAITPSVYVPAYAPKAAFSRIIDNSCVSAGIQHRFFVLRRHSLLTF